MIHGTFGYVSSRNAAGTGFMHKTPTYLSRWLALGAIALTFSAGPAAAQNFESGLSAYNRADFERAFDEWDALAQFGNPRAQFGMGLLYSFGQGVETNDVLAMDWFSRAAERGHPGAQLFLAHGYEKGEGVARDHAIAFHWYLQAAEQGLGKAQNNLGRLYEHGIGVASDIDLALYWYEEAARNGNANARASLARLRASGSEN